MPDTPVTWRRMGEQDDRDEMVELLRYANFSKVAVAVGVQRAAVANWAAGRNVTPGRLEQVRALLRRPVGSGGQTEEAPQPKWVEGLFARLEDLRLGQRRVAQEAVTGLIEALAPPDLREAAERIVAQLEVLPEPSDEAPAETDASPDPGVEGPPAQGHESHRALDG